MKRLFSFLVILLTFFSAKAQNNTAGAISLGMANSSVAVSDLWSVYNNQGALGWFDGMQAGIYYENRFNLPEFGVKSLAFASSLKTGTLGFSVSNFGFSKYSETKAGFAYAMKLAKFIAVGVQADYLYFFQDNNYGSISKVTGEIGIYSNPFENFYVGTHIFNPWRTKLAAYQDERIPTIFRLGIAYDFSEQVRLTSEVEKDLDYPAFFKLGLKYEPVENLQLYTGLALSDGVFYESFGLGYFYKNITIALSFENQPVIGMKSGVSVAYTIK